MPELPEVETARSGIEPHLVKQTISQVIIRHSQLRWPIAANLAENLVGQTIKQVARRGKYLLLYMTTGCLIIHLGMSGKLRILTKAEPPQKHDHCDIILKNGMMLRYNDPRRFGAILWTTTEPLKHILLNALGKEPLSATFNKNYLFALTRNKSASIKQIIMDGKIVVGVGNIYASESLFLAKILPTRSASSLTEQECAHLVNAIKKVLKQAIAAGGTTLKDFLKSDGKPGYFSQKLLVYGKANRPCSNCGQPIQIIKLGQRATYFCSHCQI